ncbi:hypothetical protein QL285_045521 [Trifolium repens]|nr:hypothetical protein QL285_045521 [Trifolium repens]
MFCPNHVSAAVLPEKKQAASGDSALLCNATAIEVIGLQCSNSFNRLHSPLIRFVLIIHPFALFNLQSPGSLRGLRRSRSEASTPGTCSISLIVYGSDVSRRLLSKVPES